ncbi:MAG TPA: tetratricopeptide repeat protein [Streptosporangiaceae bacterium]|jgi:tetratricopeptide (TPR) repeat protein/transcriptional regulator with XRE-family HTH domain
MAMPEATTFAQLLKTYRLRKRWTQAQLADFSGVGANTISELERRKILTPHRDTVDRLADALELGADVRAGFEAAARKDAPAGAPSAAAAATRALPPDIRSFTGRAAELRHIVSRAQEQEIAAIHVIGGMAGAGKTAFAVHVAHQLAAVFPDGQLFLQLYGHTPDREPVSPADALRSLLLAIGVIASEIPSGIDHRAGLWRSRLAGKKLLLVLDDAVSSDQIRPLLPGHPGSLVLITSRRRLTALDDVSAIELGALRAEESAELIIRLVGRSGLQPGDPAVSEIADRCGHLPLAVAMMARRLHYHPAWTAADLAADLIDAINSQDRLRYLTAENLSVAAAFDRSYTDLSAVQQRLFRLLGLHPGVDCDAYSAAALTGTSLSSVRADLDVLCDHYLLAESSHGRYRSHDLIREHARTLAASDPPGEIAAALSRLLDYYAICLSTAARHATVRSPARDAYRVLVPPQDVPDLRAREDAFAWLDAERLNLDAASRYAARHGYTDIALTLVAGMNGYLRTHGYWDQALALNQVALDLARNSGHKAEADLLTELGDLRFLMGDYSAAETDAQRAAEMYRGFGEEIGEANALDCLGVTRNALGDYPAATAAFESALALYQRLDDDLGEANVRCDLASLQFVSGNYEAAIANLICARELHGGLGNRNGEANALIQLGGVQYETGQYPDARVNLTQALALHRNLRTRNGEANALYYLGAVQAAQHDFAAAADSLGQALRIYRELGSKLGEAGTLTELGSVLYHSAGDIRVAAASLDQALRIYRELSDRYGQAEVLNVLGEIMLAAGSPEEAFAWHKQALTVATEISAPLAEARALEGAGNCQLRAGRAAEGTAQLRQALAIYQRIRSAHAKRVQAVLRDSNL